MLKWPLYWSSITLWLEPFKAGHNVWNQTEFALVTFFLISFRVCVCVVCRGWGAMMEGSWKSVPNQTFPKPEEGRAVMADLLKRRGAAADHRLTQLRQLQERLFSIRCHGPVQRLPVNDHGVGILRVAALPPTSLWWGGGVTRGGGVREEGDIEVTLRSLPSTRCVTLDLTQVVVQQIHSGLLSHTQYNTV